MVKQFELNLTINKNWQWIVINLQFRLVLYVEINLIKINQKIMILSNSLSHLHIFIHFPMNHSRLLSSL